MSEFRGQRWSLKGMTAIVTCGTRGIGYAIVEELAAFGALEHTYSSNETDISDRIQEWKSKGLKVSGTVSVCDLSSEGEADADCLFCIRWQA